MRTRPIGSLDASVIGLGCNNFGKRLDERGTREVLDAALAEGVTFLDTADLYGAPNGESERLMGRALNGRRDAFVLATKFGHPGNQGPPSNARPENVRAALEASLKRLGVDHVDLYQLHMPDDEVPVADTLGALHEAVAAGLVREIGCSNFSAAQLDEAHEAAGDGPRFVSVQNEYSMMRRAPERDVLPACDRLGVAFLPYFPLLSGILTGKYRKDRALPEGTRVTGSDRWERLLTPETYDLIERLIDFARGHDRELIDLAFAYLLAHAPVASVIAGATTPEQIRRNARAGAWELNANELAEVRTILDEAGEVAPAS